MTITDNSLSSAELAFVEQATASAEHVFRVLRETGTISASRTVQVNERIPDESGTPSKLLGLVFPNAWKRQTRVTPRGGGAARVHRSTPSRSRLHPRAAGARSRHPRDHRSERWRDRMGPQRTSRDG